MTRYSIDSGAFFGYAVADALVLHPRVEQVFLGAVSIILVLDCQEHREACEILTPYIDADLLRNMVKIAAS